MVTAASARDSNIQALRAIAALLVVCDHLFECVQVGAPRIGSINGWFPREQFGACGVDLFFVISGYVAMVATERAPSPARYLVARWRRVVPLAWVATGVFCAIAAVQQTPIAVRPLLNSLTFLPILTSGPYAGSIPGVCWTLAFETLFYLVFAGLLYLPPARRRGGLILFLGTMALTGLVWTPGSALGQFAFNPILIEFAFGVIAHGIIQRGLSRWLRPMLAFAGGTMFIWSFAKGFDFAVEPAALLTGLSAQARVLHWGVPAMLLVLGLAGARAVFPGTIVRLGDASYSIYLFHTIATTVIAGHWGRWDVTGCNMLIATMFAVALLIGLAVHHLIERPLLARLRRQASVAASASTVSPRSLTSAKPPSTWMRAETVLALE